MLQKKTSMVFLACIAILLIVVGLVLPPIPQPQEYHNFADQRIIEGFPNFWNVFSNIPFALVGIWGLLLLISPGKISFVNNQERLPWIGFTIGLILTAAGSSYYHMAPDNDRLFWDRLPITITFMSLVTAFICERYSISLGLWLWPILLLVGFWSVFLWKASEVHGASDLRFYLGVQIFTLLTILVMLCTSSPYTQNWNLVLVVLCYALAIFFERWDQQIYQWSEKVVSGHTLKHLSAALASGCLIWMIWKRKMINYRT